MYPQKKSKSICVSLHTSLYQTKKILTSQKRIGKTFSPIPKILICVCAVWGLEGWPGGGGNHGKFQRSFRKNIDSYLCLKERQISYEILIDASKQIHPCLIIMIEITCTCTSFIPLNVTMDNAIVNTVKEHSSCLIPWKHFFHS